ncbi:unnamed protein product [Gadus morhua 'NCC']
MPRWEYHALLPTGNQRLQIQWDKASYEIHRRKVKTIEPTINTAAPRSHGHQALKSKKQQLEEELALKIERDNHMLSEKIALIKRTNGLNGHSESHERKSLSGERRRQELFRVSGENQVLLIRLGQCRSFYSVKAWHDEWLKTLKVMESITQYPPRHRTVVKELGQQGLEKSIKRCSEEKSKADSSIHHPENHLMNNKTDVEKEEMKKEPESQNTAQEESLRAS